MSHRSQPRECKAEHSDAGKQSVDYKDCTLNATKEGYTVASLGGKYLLNADWSEMTIQTNTQCIGNVTLSRKSNGYRWGH